MRVCYWRKWLKFRLLLNLKEKLCYLFTYICFSHCYLLAFDRGDAALRWEGPQSVCSGKHHGFCAVKFLVVLE